jgi:RNA helicase armi
MRLQKSEIGRHKITISTLSTIGNLMHIKFVRNHFTHIILDEAGQSVESETLIPLTLLAEAPGGQVILAGDHKQLGPIVTSKFSKNLGYETSFLQRIQETWGYYQRDKKFEEFGSYDPCFVTKLLKNYRSLPSILNVFNHLFYLEELIPMVANNSREGLILSLLDDMLPNPVSFIRFT